MNNTRYRTNPTLAGQLRHLSALDDIGSFQEIIRVLTSCREKRRSLNNPEPETRYMRMAIACAHPEDITVLLGKWDPDIYYVAVRLETRVGMLRSAWIIDDDIAQKRRELAGEAGHPAHTTVCMSDLFNRAEEIDVSRFEALDRGPGC